MCRQGDLVDAPSLSFGYDAKGNLTSVNNPAPLGDLTLTPDGLSRLKTKVDGKAQTTSYTYDGVDRPDVVTFAGGATVDSDYDPDGDRFLWRRRWLCRGRPLR